MDKIISSPNTRKYISKNNTKRTKLPKKVAILYTDEKREYFSTEEEFYTVSGSLDEAKAFGPVLQSLGVEPCFIVGDHNIAKQLEINKPDMAINLVTTVKGYDYLGATIPATLELLEIPYTGADILGFSLGCNKYLTYALMDQHGIPVPGFQLLTDISTPIDKKLKYPLILKLNEEHSNVEIKQESVVENEKQLRKRQRYLVKNYDQDVLVSEFIDGREFAAFIFKSTNKKTYIMERHIHLPNNKTKYQFMDYNLVWHESSNRKHLDYSKYKDTKLEKLVKKAFDVVRMDDYGKFDIRMDKKGNYFFIDANANCHFGPPDWGCEMTLTLKKFGVPFKTVLHRLMLNTMHEWGY